MQIYGCIKNDENNFDFYCNTNNEQTRKIEEFYTFSDKKIFIYIDGTISKISETILQSSQNFESIEKKLNKCNKSDLVITSAGVSKGDFDIVKDVLSKNGTIELQFL